AIRRKPPTASSTCWCRTRPTRTCSRAAGRCSTSALPKRWKRNFRKLRRPNQSCWPCTMPEQDSLIRPSATGRLLRSGRFSVPLKALALLATLPESGERDERELDLQTRLGATLTTVKGFAAPEVAAAYDRARILCRESQAPARKFSVLRGLWVYDLVRSEWQAAGDLAEEMLALADDQQNIGYKLESQRALGMTFLWRGMIVRARGHLEEGRRLYDPEQHRIHAFRYGNDPGIACLVHEAFALWVLGYADQALIYAKRKEYPRAKGAIATR